MCIFKSDNKSETTYSSAFVGGSETFENVTEENDYIWKKWGVVDECEDGKHYYLLKNCNILKE